eukprot:21312-Heterococcus_DN1.PRE.2
MRQISAMLTLRHRSSVCTLVLLAKQSSTPLHYACQRGHQDIIALLIANGANTTAVNSKKQAPLDVIGELCYVRHDIVKAIKSKVSASLHNHLYMEHVNDWTRHIGLSACVHSVRRHAMVLHCTCSRSLSIQLLLHGMQGEVRAEATSLRNDRDALEKRVTELEEDLQRTENKLEK